MRQLSPLPDALDYLGPFRKQVAKLSPGENIEDMDLSLLNKLLLNRIRGVSRETGKARLQADREILETWLATRGIKDNGSMSFLRGYLMALPGLVDQLREEQNQSPENAGVHMDLPAEAKRKRGIGNGGWQTGWLKVKVVVLPAKDSDRPPLGDFTGPMWDKAIVSSTNVVFGAVSGRKLMADIPIGAGARFIQYDLQAPGGRVFVGLIMDGTQRDPAPFENYFNTIKVLGSPK